MVTGINGYWDQWLLGSMVTKIEIQSEEEIQMEAFSNHQ